MEEENDLEDAFEYAKGVARKRFNDINEKSLDLIEAYITDGYKKTLVNLLLYLGRQRADRVMKKMPEEFRREIDGQLQVCTNPRTSPEVIVDAAYVYKKAGWYGRTMAEDVIENLTPLEISAVNYYQDDFFEANPILQMNIENFSISFNELGRLDDRAIQKVLREVDMDVLALALKKAEEKVKQKIYRNMSARAAALLKENMEFMGPVNQINIEEAQCKIIKAAMKLEREGEIVIVKDY